MTHQAVTVHMRNRSHKAEITRSWILSTCDSRSPQPEGNRRASRSSASSAPTHLRDVSAGRAAARIADRSRSRLDSRSVEITSAEVPRLVRDCWRDFEFWLAEPRRGSA
jgi:hypothetical protein